MQIDISSPELDKENRNWANTYVARLEQLLMSEEGSESPDSSYCSFLTGELSAYRELLERCAADGT